MPKKCPPVLGWALGCAGFCPPAAGRSGGQESLPERVHAFRTTVGQGAVEFFWRCSPAANQSTCTPPRLLSSLCLRRAKRLQEGPGLAHSGKHAARPTLLLQMMMGPGWEQVVGGLTEWILAHAAPAQKL